MPTPTHRRILRFLFKALEQFVEQDGLGEIFFAPVPLRVDESKYREPDLLFVSRDHAEWVGPQALRGADMVAEIVSPGDENRERDLVKKREDYAACGVVEYWIIDPELHQVAVLTLRAGAYVDGLAGQGEQARSVVVSGFSVDVGELMAAAR